MRAAQKYFLASILMAASLALLSALLLEERPAQRIVFGVLAFATLVVLFQSVGLFLSSRHAALVHRLTTVVARSRQKLAARIDPNSRTVKLDSSFFVGREKELADLVRRVGELGLRGGIICYVGVLGVGKSHFLQQAVLSLNAQTESAALVAMPRMEEASLSQTIATSLRLPLASAGSDELTRLDTVIRMAHRKVLLLDNLPTSDPIRMSELNWVVDNARLQNRPVVIIGASTASPGPDSLTSETVVVTFTGLELEAFLQLAENVRPGAVPVADLTIIWTRLAGNPQLLKMQLRSDTPTELPEDAQQLLNRMVWAQLSDDTRDAVAFLAALHEYQTEIPVGDLRYMFVNWAEISSALRDRALCGVSKQNFFKVHDFVCELARRNIPEATYVAAHRKAGEFYLSRVPSSEGRAETLTVAHSLRARIELSASVFANLGARFQLLGLSRDAIKLVEGWPAVSAESADSTRLYAWALLQQGKTSEAYELLKERLVKGPLKTGQPVSAPDLMEYRQLADYLRLTGRVGEARALLGEVLTSAETADLAEQDVLLVALDAAHGYYLDGDATGSLRELAVLSQRSKQCSRETEAEYEYRLAKALRLNGQFEAAVVAADLAEKIYNELGSVVGAAKANWASSGAYRFVGSDPRDIQTRLEVSRDRLSAVGYRSWLFTLHDLADWHRRIGNLDLAASLFRRVLELAQALGESNRTAHSHLGLGVVAALESSGDASDHISRASRIYREIKCDWGFVNCVWMDASLGLGLWGNDERVRALNIAKKLGLVREHSLLTTSDVPLDLINWL